jgi:hypothetical protein
MVALPKRGVSGARIYGSISPLSLVLIVIINFLLIYLNLVSLENQSEILQKIEQNTELALFNQDLGLNGSAQNQRILAYLVTNFNSTFADQLAANDAEEIEILKNISDTLQQHANTE